MKNDLFEKAKKAVAEKHGKKEWLELCLFGANEMPTWYQEVAEWMCNEAVKADRENITSLIQLEGLQFDGNVFAPIVDAQIVLKRPLPFPQQPDGM